MVNISVMLTCVPFTFPRVIRDCSDFDGRDSEDLSTDIRINHVSGAILASNHD